MTLSQLLQLALSQLGEDQQDLPDYQQALTTYINEGYTALCNSAYHPQYSQQVTLTDHQFDVSQLVHAPVRICAIHGPHKLRFDKFGTTVQVDTGAQTPDTVQVVYEYTPPPLTQDEDQPILPVGVHTALADWATARMLGTGTRTRQARAEFFLLRFYEAKNRLNAQNAGERLINQFT